MGGLQSGETYNLTTVPPPFCAATGRASPGLRADMERHGIIAALGPQHLHASLHAALADARQAQP